LKFHLFICFDSSVLIKNKVGFVFKKRVFFAPNICCSALKIAVACQLQKKDSDASIA
jgi:hypothetical protein